MDKGWSKTKKLSALLSEVLIYLAQVAGMSQPVRSSMFARQPTSVDTFFRPAG